MYPWGNEKVNFVSYYPYQSAITNYKIPVDVENVTDMGLLYANGVGTALEKGDPVTFNYTSQLCVLEIKVTSEDDHINLSQAAPQLTLDGMPVTANFDLSEGRHTDYQTGPLELDAVQSSATEASWKTFVIPHAEYSKWGHDRTFTFTFFGQTPNEQTHTFYLPVDFKFVAGHNYELEFEVKKPSVAPPDDGKANCFMVEPGERFTFKTARAYEEEGVSNTTLRVDKQAGTSYTGKFEAAVLWDDAGVIRGVIVKGAGSDAEVTVITDNDSKPSGNAVVAIKKAGTDEIVWSYHIWVTNPDDIGTVPMVNGHVFMDRNLGATAGDLSVAAYGLLYQWGRKDPFPGSVTGSAGWNAASSFSFGSDNKVTNQTANAAGITAGIIETIQNPMTFYVSVYNGNWLPAHENTLWRASGGEKAIYDPCPADWRVPVYVDNFPSDKANSPWQEYDEDYWISTGTTCTWDAINKGWTFTRDIFIANYPAAGDRSGGSGSASSGGQGGGYWGATPYNHYAGFLFFNPAAILTANGYARASGFSVRCVREITTP
jgi:hypothetical protein